MALWPRPVPESSPPGLDDIRREVEAFARGPLPAWEAGYLDYHRRRYQDTLRLLPEGQGRRLLDVGAFPGHLSALAQARGFQVTGLNSSIEGAGSWAIFLERCRERKIEVLPCEVEREPFPVPTESFDAVLFCELFEHLYQNPFHTLREIFRVLRPGGLLILTTPNLRRVEMLFRFLHDWGFQPPVSRPFPELLPSLLHHRHNREYTANELDYYLARQGKDLYDFRPERIHYSDCLDDGHEIPAIQGRRGGALEQAVARGIRRLWPRTRGQLMARAWRSPARFVDWAALSDVAGIGLLEDDEQRVQGFTRRLAFPFRRAGSAAAFTVPVPPGEGPVLLSFMLAHLDDSEAPPPWVTVTLDGAPATTIELPPAAARPVRLWVMVPAGIAARGRVRIGLVIGTALEPDRPHPHRLHLGGHGLLVEPLSGEAAAGAALARVAALATAEESTGERWWHPAEGLYVPHRATGARIAMGPGDEAQLGPGWYGREDWGRLGRMRWTGTTAIAHLRATGRQRSLRLRAYAGPAALGPARGELRLELARPGHLHAPAGRVAFALEPDRWGELSAPLSGEVGHLRLTLRAEAPRVPSALLPDSQDPRALGLAVQSLWLATDP